MFQLFKSILFLVINMDWVVREVNGRVLGKGGLELLSVNCTRSEINQLLFADDTALVADSEKLCWLVSGLGGVCERRKLRVNVGNKSKVMRCSRYGNCGRLLVRLNDGSLEGVDCISTGGCGWRL